MQIDVSGGHFSSLLGAVIRGGGSQIWNGYGCKGWGIQWEHRLKKWGVIGWEHDFWHSVREKYKNMCGHQVRAKMSQKSRVFGCYFKKKHCMSTTWNPVWCQLFKSWGFEWQIKCKNMGLWVWAHATVKKYGVYGCQRCWKNGVFWPLHTRHLQNGTAPPRAVITPLRKPCFRKGHHGIKAYKDDDNPRLSDSFSATPFLRREEVSRAVTRLSLLCWQDIRTFLHFSFMFSINFSSFFFSSSFDPPGL